MSDYRSVQLKPCCLDLRHKMMYCDERQSTPGLVDDRSNTRVYFCIRTMEVVGPDSEPVMPRACQQGRACCRMGVTSESVQPTPAPPEPDLGVS